MSLAVRTSKKPAHKQGKAQVREQRAQIQGQVRTNGISRPQIAKPRICKSDFRKFLRGLDEGSTDLVLTDPPYAISRETALKTSARIAWSDSPSPWISARGTQNPLTLPLCAMNRTAYCATAAPPSSGTTCGNSQTCATLW